MPLFKSSREKRYWIYALLVFLTIFSALFLGRPLQVMLRDQNIQTVFFLSGMLLTGVTVIIHGLKIRPSKTEWAIWIGLATVFTMFIFRLGAPERSHVIEYSVLAIFIHKALIERLGQRNKFLISGLIAFVITVLIGILDESIQKFLPERVFDPDDMLFNGLAALMAIGGSMFLNWARHKFRKTRID